MRFQCVTRFLFNPELHALAKEFDQWLEATGREGKAGEKSLSFKSTKKGSIERIKRCSPCMRDMLVAFLLSALGVKGRRLPEAGNLFECFL
jgi:hypothetical protein